LRIVGWLLAGVAVWLLAGWPVAGIAVAGTGIWLPWLLGSARVTRVEIDTVAGLAMWCRRMADTLTGGGAVGLSQAIITSAEHAPDEIAEPVAQLADALRRSHADRDAALRRFADDIDDRIGDTVAAALGLALEQQTAGVATVLRQLADAVDRDVRTRREIEAERAESRQSITTLLLVQVGVFVLLALAPGFAAPYRTTTGQIAMALLLAGTVGLLVWMRRLALGHRAPRFLGTLR
jgi:hypothetical protein